VGYLESYLDPLGITSMLDGDKGYKVPDQERSPSKGAAFG
jgi:hypothetical protein